MNAARVSLLVAIVALVVAISSVIRLEGLRSSVEIETRHFGETPVTIYRGPETAPSLVVISHGFAGSRQMMEAVSLTLARSGHVVASFDYIGHGRHREALSPDINSLTGTTEDLVRQTLDVVTQAREQTGLDAVSLIGHSMATDVVVRAAGRLEGVRNVVAISMYSEAVTQDHPSRLLIVSGAHEERLREIAVDAVAQLGARVEGETVTRDAAERRAVAAPWVGHVGVLWSSVTSSEISAWLGQPGAPVSTAPWIVALLAAIIVLFWPVASHLPNTTPVQALPLRRSVLASLLPAPVALLAGLSGLPALGLAGFGALALFFGVWGCVALLVLRPSVKLRHQDAWAALALLVWALLIFALAMDRYAAAFLPTGPRVMLMGFLMPATIVFAIADRVMVHGRHPFIRILLRVPCFAALLGVMIIGQREVGVLFTVLPVLLLFYLVYGTMAAWASRHSAPFWAGGASGIILAWSIAASTPLFLPA